MTYTALLSEFRQKNKEFSLSQAKNSMALIVAILQAHTVCLYQLRNKVGAILGNKGSKADSHYKRLTRFFAFNAKGPLWLSLLRIGLGMMGVPPGTLLYLDGTEWAFGSFKIHILVLAVDFHGSAVPVYFQVYNHKGVLSAKERSAFMERALERCSLSGFTVVADREFIGDEWFRALAMKNLFFVIRLRKGQYCDSLEDGRSYATLERRAAKKGRASALVRIKGRLFRLWVVKNASKSESEPLVYMLTNHMTNRNSPGLYRLRWKIETCFRHLKTNGFNLEDLAFKDLGKIRLLFPLLAIVYILSILEGLKNPKKEYVGKKKYKQGKSYASVSVFKLGCSFCEQSICLLEDVLLAIASIVHGQKKGTLFKNVQ